MTLWMVLSMPALAMLAQEPATPGAHVAQQIACGPMSVSAAPVAGIQVAGGFEPGRLSYAPGERIVLSAGANQGIKAGQRYFVRRQVHDMFTPAAPDFTPISIHTAGWVTVIETRDELSVAEITLGCDTVLRGDYLEPYTEPVVPAPTPAGAPDFDNPARIVMADEMKQTGSEGTMMLINRGSEMGVQAGQTLTIYRVTLSGTGPSVIVGSGTVLSVRPQTSLMRVDQSRDAVYIGDLAALHRVQ